MHGLNVDRPSLPSSPGVTLVVAAMSSELAPLVAGAEVRRRERVGGCRAVRGRVAGAEVVLASTGEGRRRADLGARALLAHYPVRAMLVVGIAGGLSPSLALGSVVLARGIVDGDRPAPRPDARWFEQAALRDDLVPGRVLSGDRILCDVASKAEAWRRLAAAEPATVDLESAAFARAAADHGVPFLVLRAVSDAADEALPFDLNRCVDASGRVSRVRVVGQALRRPAVVPGLFELRRRVHTCALRLARVAEGLLAGPDAGVPR